jgi:hypothetical protein
MNEQTRTVPENAPGWVQYEAAVGVECRSCGREEVGTKAHAVGYDFCRNCFHTGQADELLRSDQLDDLRARMPGWTVGVEHTGGGCFWLAFYPPNHDPERHTHYAATDGEASLPTGPNPDAEADDAAAGTRSEVPIRGGWGYVGRYFYSTDDAEWNEHPDMEGTIILDAKPTGLETRTVTHAVTGEAVTYEAASDLYWTEYPKHSRTDDEVVEAILADWEKVRA